MSTKDNDGPRTINQQYVILSVFSFLLLRMTGIRHVVWTWLHTLDQEHLFDSFLENGYDDLETVKQMGEEDLLAIGVEDQETRFVISQAARMLREKGAAWVYFIR